MIARQIHIFGKVQGVFFRASTKEKADKLGVKGWVRNENDGSVMIEAFGSEKSISELIKWCHEGSQFSKVSEVVVEKMEKKDYPDFSIVH